jgi:hypothetical protein
VPGFRPTAPQPAAVRGFLANVHYLPDPATRNLSYDHFPPPLITGSRGSPLAP